jgi:DNA-binding beta-propeller fold protein YncE
MRRFYPLLLPTALAIAGCSNGASNDAAPGGTSTANAAAPTSSANATASAIRKPPPTREGSTIVRAPNDDALYVADEDHGVVRKIPLPFDAAAPFVSIPVPGQPAQVLALHDRVLVTIRSEGGAPPAAPGRENGAPDAIPATSGTPAAGAPPPAAPAPPAKSPGSAKSRIPASPTGPGLLLIMKPDAAAGLVEVARVTLPADAWGIAVTPDDKTAIVSSAWTHQVSAIDLATAKKTWSIDVPREPRAVVVRPDGASAYVTHLVGGAITRIDGISGQPSTKPVSLPPSPLRSPSGKTLDGTLAYSGVLSPDGSRLFVARHAIGALGEAAWFGAATVDVLLTASDSPLAPKREANLPRAESELTKQMRPHAEESHGSFPRAAHTPFSAPRAIAYKKRTQTLLVASEGTNAVVELDARAVDPSLFVKSTIRVGSKPDNLIPVATVGGAPSGLALSADESTLWVHCRTTSDIIEVRFSDKPSSEKSSKDLARLRLGEDLLDEKDAKGRRIFYDATDSITSGGVSCAGCHPDGRDDGHVWHEATFKARFADKEEANFLGDGDQAPFESTKQVGFARQTPMLAGRVSAAGPYGWHAESPDLVARLIAGFKLHRWGQVSTTYGDGELLGRAQYLAPFLRHGLVPPPRDVHPLTPEEARGKEIFMSDQARCAKCHAPETEYTDRIAIPLFPKLAPITGFKEEENQQFKTPSLLYVSGTAPYFHDGRASSLEVLIERNGDRMGKTSHLSAEDRRALVAFLRTL